jgi:chromosome segregation ATPase
MKKVIVISLIGAVALFAIAKKTNVFSYANTLVTQVSTDAQKQIPTKFELERIRQEIASLDTDISAMIRPIAEYKADVQKLNKDIAAGQRSIEERKEKYLAIVKDLDANKKDWRFCGKTYSPEQVRRQLNRDLDTLKLQEKNVKTQQQVLDAKLASLTATQEQLAKVVGKKREYEARLAQLEALDQSLQVARIGSDIKIDDSRATQIESALQALEHRLKADSEELKMRTGDIGNLNLFEREPEPVDLQSIRNYLEGNAETASTK